MVAGSVSEQRQWRDHCGRLLDKVESFDVIECAACRFIHVIPLLTPDEVSGLYKDRYYADEKPLYFERHREDLDWWNLVYRERYDRYEDLLPGSRRRILDVGSGPGFFLLHGKQRGWSVMGIEPSRQAAAHARGLGVEIVNEFLGRNTAPRLGAFDVIHMHEVLEHLPAPGDMLDLCGEMLGPGGLLNIVAPNDYNPIQNLLREHFGYQPWWLAPPAHLNYFTPASLRGLVERAGFEVVHLTTTFPIDVFLLMGDDYVGNDEVGRAAHGRRKRLEQALEKGGLGQLKRDLYQAFCRAGVGREIDILARRRS